MSSSERRAGEAVPDERLKRKLEVALAPVEVADLPVIDLDAFMDKEESVGAQIECQKLVDALHRFGSFVVRDPRVSEEDNNVFLNTMERYFEQPEESKADDIKPDLHYQVGATPSFVERPRDHCTRMREHDDANAPMSLCPPELDPKWRFFWRIGDRPTDTKFEDLNAEAVVPPAIPEWSSVMDTWGHKMLTALQTLANMASRGFGMAPSTLPDMMNMGPHLLAPTGSDFGKFGELGTVLAGYHYDLNFMTIHGKSRYPGLYIWLRDGRKVAVKVPDGCLLVQAGKQFEYVTGGYVLAGFHEVCVVPRTVEAIDAARAEGRSLWRVSSTLFGHLASDVPLRVLDPFLPSNRTRLPGCMLEGGGDDEDAAVRAAYPDILTGDFVREELRQIALAKSD